MELNNSKDDAVNDTTNSKDSEEEESFVTKVRSRVSGLFSSSFSRLFKNQRSGVIRPRSNEDEEATEHQPPSKRAKGMENETLSAQNFRGNAISHSQFMASLNNESGSESTGEPIAGPSYISQRNIQKIVPSASTPLGVTSREKCGDSEYTSGYSSMAKFVEKQAILGGKSISESASEPILNSFSERKSLFNTSTSATPSRSLFANQSVSPQDKNTSLSSRKPSFSTSNFGSPSFVDRTLTTSKIINSPFYNGSTIYGGASAYGRQLGINETRKQQLKNSFLVKPINKSSDTKSFTSLSKTARRILETLEQCSSPMTDVKKVPLPTRTDKQGVFSRYVAANPYQKSSNVSKRELLVPSVSERLKMKQIQRLQDTTNEIRQIANSSNSNLNSEGYKVATNNQQKHNNKMKTKITSVRNKAPMIDVLDNYILNPVPLMIPENKYPTFELPELNIPTDDKNEENQVGTAEPSLTKTTLVEGKGDSNTDKDKFDTEENQVVTFKSNNTEQKISINEKGGKEINASSEYTFSKPLVIAENSKSLIAINNFKFSEPLSKKIKLNISANERIEKKFQINETITMTNGNISCDVDLKKSSDPLLEKFKAPEGTWECQTCLIRNKSEATKCAACETPRVDKSQTMKKDSSSSFGVQFSKKLDEWDCSTCLVRNKVQNNVCIACSTPKVSKPETNGVGNKYKSPCKEWECGTCWVRNKSESLRCVACESIRNVSASKLNDELKSLPKQKCQKCFNEIENDGKCTKCNINNINQLNFNIPSHLKPSTDTWECGTCLIRNKNDLKKCAACETPREKLNNDIKAASFSKKSDKWECPTCMVQNNSDVEKCPCCETAKPGVTLISKSNVNMFNFGVNKTQFSFGIPKDMQNSSPLPVSTSSFFANNTSGSSSTNSGFKFGIVSESKENKTEQLTSTSSVPKSENKPESSSSKFQPSSNKTEKNDTFQFKAPSAVSDQNSLPMFKFGSPAPDLKEPPKDAAASNILFKFTPPKSIAVENNPTIPPSEGVKKTENEKNSFAVPSVSQGDSGNKTFSFGSKDNDSKEQTAKPMFSFGSSSSSTQPGGFNFNTVKSDLVQQATKSTGFASTPVQPLQSTNSGGRALKNGGFNFGSSTNSNQAAVFSFGATQNPAQTMPLAKGGFDFSTVAKPTGGFSFTSPTPSTADAGSKPTFNFTGGSIPTFSANPTEGGGGPVPVRKFKRAVRRTQR